MPKLPQVRPKQAIRALTKVGYVQDRVSGSHHILYKEGSAPITVPYHNKPLKKGTLACILKQANLAVEDFIDLL